MRIRIADVDDAEDIARIHMLTWRCAYRGLVSDRFLDSLSVEQRRALWRERIERAPGIVLIAADGAACGWIACGRARDDDAPPATGEVWALDVLPAPWWRCTARALWSAARERLIGDGMKPAMQWVFSDNVRARAAYERMGWQPEPGSERTYELSGRTMRETRFRIALE